MTYTKILEVMSAGLCGSISMSIFVLVFGPTFQLTLFEGITLVNLFAGVLAFAVMANDTP